MAEKGTGTPAPPSAKAAEKTLIPGNFLTFPVSIEVHVGGTAHMGYPAMAVRDVTSGTVRWALDSSIFLRESPLQSLTWEDDPERGIGQRTLVNVEDVLGAEGRLQEHSYRFEQVLGLGPKLVVYALFNPSSGSRLAYSFFREVFEPGYVSPQPSEE